MARTEPEHGQSTLQRLRCRLRNRPDTEHEQALVRVALNLMAFVYLGSVAILSQPSPGVRHGFIILCLFLFFSLSMLAAIIAKPHASITRRITSMLSDMGMISYLLFYYGEIMAPFYIAYIWVSSGYGLRYGNPYLLASTIMAAFGFSLVLIYNDYWQANQATGWGLWLGLIVLPMYIASLLAKLSRALKAAETANEAKSRFIANMSHEIRTPINGVIGLLELLSATQLAEKQRTLVQGAQSSTTTLLHLLEDVLDISKIEAGRISQTLVPFDLHALINGVVGLFDYEACNKNLLLQRQIDPSCPFRLVGDELHLRQVLMNLVSNAVKFTEQGRIDVRVCADRVTDERVWLRFEVSDTGIGISKEAQAYIFEPFRQEDERITRRFGGSGLGMSIAKQLTDLMEGELSVESTVGQGSLFTLLLECELGESTSQLTPLEFIGSVRLLSQDDDLIDQVSGWLNEWRVKCSPHYDLVSEFTEQVVLIDARAFSHPEFLLKEYPVLEGRDLLLFVDEETPSFDSSAAGFSGALEIPLEKEQLYTLLHSVQATVFDDGVASLQMDQAALLSAANADILVAEDNRINQRVTCSSLEQIGHQITLVEDGEAALQALQTRHFHLAVVDMMMPGLGGLEVIERYRELEGESRQMPFIVLTANVSDEARTACEALGVKYLTKPLRVRTLQAAVQMLLMPSDKKQLSQ